MSTFRSRVLLALLALPLLADAQATSADGMVVGPGGLCMDVDSNAPGASVILTACSGLSRQRWRYMMGDTQGLQHIPSQRCPEPDAHDDKLVLGARCPDWWFGPNASGLRYQERCVTAPLGGTRVPLSLRPCDGSPGQRFTFR